ncbi:MAG: hypothetical protein KGH72_00675 [Candidatus Micrarchaeota archaeon]|nr:hypothetical protein [Candidatus Micrarchaeota archaeon]
MANEYLTFSLIFLAVWLLVFLLKKPLRREMFWVSIFTMPFGLTEPLFIPFYWHPPTLFNLATTSGFDIESLIFSFAVGGLGAILYEIFFRSEHIRVSKHEMHSPRHRFHLLAIISPVIVFVLLHFLTSLNPIYAASIAMFIGGIATMLCRPDLSKRVITGGITFLAIYFVFFLLFVMVYPYAVKGFWNLGALSGILVIGIPIEELIFAFTFGMMWSSVYEHINWYRNK